MHPFGLHSHPARRKPAPEFAVGIHSGPAQRPPIGAWGQKGEPIEPSKFRKLPPQRYPSSHPRLGPSPDSCCCPLVEGSAGGSSRESTPVSTPPVSPRPRRTPQWRRPEPRHPPAFALCGQGRWGGPSATVHPTPLSSGPHLCPSQSERAPRPSNPSPAIASVWPAPASRKRTSEEPHPSWSSHESSFHGKPGASVPLGPPRFSRHCRPGVDDHERHRAPSRSSRPRRSSDTSDVRSLRRARSALRHAHDLPAIPRSRDP